MFFPLSKKKISAGKTRVKSLFVDTGGQRFIGGQVCCDNLFAQFLIDAHYHIRCPNLKTDKRATETIWTVCVVVSGFHAVMATKILSSAC